MVRNFLFAAATSVLLFSSCTNSSSTDGASGADSTAATMSSEDKEERNKKVIMASMEGLKNRNVDEMLKDAAPDVVDYNDGGMPPVKNLDTLKAGIKAWMFAVPNYKMENVEYFADGNKVLVSYEGSGTWTGDFMGMKATGKSFKAKDVEIFTLSDEGKVTEHRSIQDMGAIWAAMGAPIPAGPPEKK